MSAQIHLKEAENLYQRTMEEFRRAREKNDGTLLRDVCDKGWLSAIEATHALLVKKAVIEKREKS